MKKTVQAASFVFAALAGCSQEPAPTSSPEASTSSAPAIEEIANTRQIMLGITGPASDVVFQVGSTPPQDDAGWEKVAASALSVAESGNLLKMAGRRIDDDDWLQFTNTLIDAARDAAQAAQQKNADMVLEAGNVMYEACEGCHQKYMAARGGM